MDPLSNKMKSGPRLNRLGRNHPHAYMSDPGTDHTHTDHDTIDVAADCTVPVRFSGDSFTFRT